MSSKVNIIECQICNFAVTFGGGIGIKNCSQVKLSSLGLKAQEFSQVL